MSPELAVGSTKELVVEGLDRRDFVKYAGASGDVNPIHYDQSTAEAAGYEEVFGQGMLVAGIASNLVTDWVGLQALTGLQFRFVGQVWPGDRVVVTGEVTSIADDGVCAIDLTATNGTGERLLDGEATVTIP